MATPTSITSRAGSSRRARRAQNWPSPMVRRSAPLPEQERRDQEPGQDEEHVDAEEPAAGERGAPVVEHDAEDGHRPQAVEGGDEPEGDGPASRHR